MTEETYPAVWVGSKVPDYLSLIVEDSLRLDFEATHGRLRSRKGPTSRVGCEVRNIVEMYLRFTSSS